MKMKNLSSLFLILLFAGNMVFSAEVSVEKAKLIGKNLFYERVNQVRDVKYNNIVFANEIIISSEAGTPVIYVFNIIGDNGFVIISAEDNVYPVLGYSFEGTYDNSDQPPAFTEWIEDYKEQIIYVKDNQLKSNSKISKAWEKYSKKPDKSPLNNVEPLVNTMWDQDCFYNELCPNDPSGACGRARVGCVAVAMVQVMKYHNYPPQGTGSHGYNSSYGYLFADFGATFYNWDDMPDYITDHNFEIAQAGYHCGVAVEMMYGPNGSGAYSESVGPALMNYFGYSSGASLEYKDDYSTSQWENLLRTELDALMPMYYSGSGSGGHAFVCDGYQNDTHFHFNWGWGGLYNGYFFVSNLHPGTHNYSNYQAALTGVKPPEDPVADFTANITTVLTGSCVCFTDLTEHTPNSWSWTFPGGSPSSSDVQNPENIFYNTPGTYSVTLTATNWNGSNTITKTDYITVTNDALPVADFDVDETNACVGETFSFVDLSLNTPDEWEWYFVPNTVTFVNSTNANSQNPQVQFNEAKVYSVTLTVSNANGSNTITKSNLINSGGLTLPFAETFEVGTFKDYWTIENPDGNITWDGYYKLSGNLPSRKAAWMNFYEYTSTGQRDRLITPLLNFAGHTTVNFKFTHAYAIYNSTRKDSVIIYISTDCGTSWERIFEAGEDFATHSPTTSEFVPSSPGDWCGAGYGDDCHTIDLSPWAGYADVKIMFESYNGHGNMMYIDDIIIYDNDVYADFTADVTVLSPGESVNFTDLSTGTVNSWEWIFDGGTPSVSNEINPVNIVYEVPGIFDVTLTVSNDSCTDTKIKESYITVNSDGPYIVQQSYEINDNSGNGNGLMDYGESILLSLGMQNVGAQQANNITVELSTDDEFITITDNIEYYGNIPSNEIISIADGFAFNVSELIPDGHNVLFDVTATDGTNNWISNFIIEAHAPNIEFGALLVSDPTGNNNGRLDPGETADIIITTTNAGSSDAINSIGNLSTTNGDVTVNNATYNFGTLPSCETDYAVFNVTVDASAQIGTTVDFCYIFSSGLYTALNYYYETIGLIVEDWETGGFGQFNWTFGGDSPWTITSSNAYEGTYCAKSGAIGDMQSSILSLTYEVMADDTISFYKKVSSEEDYDYLVFLVDNIIQEKWSGNESWSKAAYPVSAGEHTFEWVYIKDWSVSNGSDCGWIDYIVLPPASILTVNAGADATICAGYTFTCSGNAANYTSLLWTTSGTGTYDDNTILNPVYTPGIEDINAGSVILTLTAYDGQGGDLSDDMTLTIAPVPVVDLGNDTSICCYNTITLDAGNPGATYIWSTGETTQMITVDSTGVGIGSETFSVIVTNSNNCQGSDSITVTFDECTYIPEKQNNYNITLSPNPSNGTFYITIRRLKGNFKMYVLNSFGQVVYNESVNCTSEKYIKKLNLSELTKGLYYLKLINNDIIHVERFIIQ